MKDGFFLVLFQYIFTGLEAKMGDLSQNFSRIEFECQCGNCGFDTVDTKLLEALQGLHYTLSNVWTADIQIHITSGCRCQYHNRNIGGRLNSQHLLGKAADIVCSFRSKIEGKWVKIKTEMIYKLLDDLYPNTYGIGKYEKFVHIDVRNKKARW